MERKKRRGYCSSYYNNNNNNDYSYRKCSYGYSYGGYGGYSGYGLSSYGSSSISDWASKWTYTKPDYQKIKAELLVKQKKWNAMGYPIKITYGASSVVRKKSGVVRMTAQSVNDADTIRKFLDKTQFLGVMEVKEQDNDILRSLMCVGKDWTYKYNDTYYDSNDWGVFENIDRYNACIDAMPEDEIKKQKDKEKGHAMRGGRSNFVEGIVYDGVKAVAEKLKNKIKIEENKTIKEIGLRKGKRINRGYITGISYKPLVNKRTESIKQKKALLIVDSSGSMRGYLHEQASIFAEAIKLSGIFDSRLYYSSDYCLYKGDGKKMLTPDGGSEGFEELDIRLDEINISNSDYDYLFVFSDLCISQSGASNINEIAKGKKNIIFDFSEGGSVEKYQTLYEFMNIKSVKNVADMTGVLLHYI